MNTLEINKSEGDKEQKNENSEGAKKEWKKPIMEILQEGKFIEGKVYAFFETVYSVGGPS